MRPAVVRCAACGRALCDDCFRFRMDGRPGCARCAYESSTRAARRASLAVTFLGISLGGGFYAARRYDLWAESPGAMLLGGAAALGVAGLIAYSGRDARGITLENRDPAEDPLVEPVPTHGASPYRARARRALMAAAPKVSGRATALVTFACMTAAAVMLPAALHLPRWIEAELVLGIWWAVVAATLATLLYRGFRLRDDFVYFAPWDRPSSNNESTPKKNGGIDGCSGFDGCSGMDAEGCLVGAVIAVALAAAFGLAWLLVELALPLVFLLMYGLFMRAIGRVANDRHGCEGDLPRALGWGALWSTVYVLPVALIAALIGLR